MTVPDPDPDPGFYSIIDYTVDGTQTQRELVDAFAAIQERRVRSFPGYRSARFFASLDGTRVYTIVAWDSEDDWRRFDETDDRRQRAADIRQAIEGLSGHAEPRMSGAPRYRLVREVRPGPLRTNAAGPS